MDFELGDVIKNEKKHIHVEQISGKSCVLVWTFVSNAVDVVIRLCFLVSR